VTLRLAPKPPAPPSVSVETSKESIGSVDASAITGPSVSANRRDRIELREVKDLAEAARLSHQPGLCQERLDDFAKTLCRLTDNEDVKRFGQTLAVKKSGSRKLAKECDPLTSEGVLSLAAVATLELQCALLVLGRGCRLQDPPHV
jgi:hypothetical protein